MQDMSSDAIQTSSPDALRRQMAQLEQPSSSVLRTRLARAHPMHITRLARTTFLVLTLLSVAAVLASLFIPLISIEVALLLRDLDSALPMPTPLLLVLLSLCMAVAWVTAGQATLAVAYDCPMLPKEQERYDQLKRQLDLYEGNASFVENEYDSDPPPLYMPQTSLKGAATPPPVSNMQPQVHRQPEPTPGGTLQYMSKPTPNSAAGQRQATPPPAPRHGTPPGVPRQPTPPQPHYMTPEPARERTEGGLSYRRPEPGPVEPAPPESSEPKYVVGPGLDGNLYSDGAAKVASWRSPDWGDIDEPWLLDAIRKAEELGRRYPVQAFLEYSAEPDLPFTLVLERATPAMAVRAMVEYVSFLASIATPRRGRIELRSVVHHDRSFYRSVMSAMEPYFPDTVDIKQDGQRVEITFLEPERCWARVPILPLE